MLQDAGKQSISLLISNLYTSKRLLQHFLHCIWVNLKLQGVEGTSRTLLALRLHSKHHRLAQHTERWTRVNRTSPETAVNNHWTGYLLSCGISMWRFAEQNNSWHGQAHPSLQLSTVGSMTTKARRNGSVQTVREGCHFGTCWLRL